MFTAGHSSQQPAAQATNGTAHDTPVDKGKGKGKVIEDEPMDDEEDDDEDDDEEEEEAEDEDEEMAEVSPFCNHASSHVRRVHARSNELTCLQEESLDEIDPTLIQPRRTRGVRVDYTSPEALAKAGLKPGDNADEEDQPYEAKDAEMEQ